MSELDELRALVREVIRDVLPQGLPVTETVNLSTDEDLAAFVTGLLDLDPEAARGAAVGPETVQARRPAHAPSWPASSPLHLSSTRHRPTCGPGG